MIIGSVGTSVALAVVAVAIFALIVTFLKSCEDPHFFLVLPIAVLGVEECVKGSFINSAKCRPSFGIVDLLCDAGGDVEPQRNAPVAVGVVAPKDGVVPSLAEAQNSICAGNLLFPSPKAAAEFRVGLCNGPQFERIVEIVECSYL